MSIGEKLKQARLDSGLTQEAVAERAGVSRQTMSNWENGKSYPDIAGVIALSDVYGVTLDSLVKGDIAMIKHLKESTNVRKSYRQVIATLVALAMALFFNSFFILILGGRLADFVDIASGLMLIIPLLIVLTVTRSFKLFNTGFRAAFFPKKEEAPEELRAEAANLFRLLSKTAAISAVINMLIPLTNMLMNLDFTDVGGIASLQINFAAILIAPLFSLFLIMFVFEPVGFILKKRSNS